MKTLFSEGWQGDLTNLKVPHVETERQGGAQMSLDCRVTDDFSSYLFFFFGLLQILYHEYMVHSDENKTTNKT